MSAQSTPETVPWTTQRLEVDVARPVILGWLQKQWQGQNLLKNSRLFHEVRQDEEPHPLEQEQCEIHNIH